MLQIIKSFEIARFCVLVFSINPLTYKVKYMRIASTLHLESAFYHSILTNIMKNIYLIKDLAKISGFSTHTLKYYLRLGLLEEIGRSPETKFRYFDDSSCSRLKRIRELQTKKLSLKEIQGVLGSRNDSRVQVQ